VGVGVGAATGLGGPAPPWRMIRSASRRVLECGRATWRHEVTRAVAVAMASAAPHRAAGGAGAAAVTPATPSLAPTKKDLRKTVATAMRAVDDDAQQAGSDAIAARLAALPSFRSASTVVLYLHMRGEVRTDAMLRACFDAGKAVYVPRVVGPAPGDMRVVRIRDEAEVAAFPVSRWGIREPDRVGEREDVLLGRAVTEDERDPYGDDDAAAPTPAPTPATRADVAVEPDALIVLPGRAFDEHCHRLGRGGGYYDCFLARIDRCWRRRGLAPPALVGVAFDEQFVGPVPMDAHDRPLDAVVTPTRTLLRAADEGA